MSQEISKDEIYRYIRDAEEAGDTSMVNMASRVRGRFQITATAANKWVLLWAKERKQWLLSGDNKRDVIN